MQHPQTVAYLRELEERYTTAMNLADSTRELKYLDRANAFREAINLTKNSNKT